MAEVGPTSLVERQAGPKARRSRSIGKSHAAEAIKGGRQPQCHNFRGLWFVSASSLTAVPQRCKRWDCPSCVKLRRTAAVMLIQRGIEKAQSAHGRHAVRFVTLTDDAAGEMDAAGLYSSWQKLALRLRRRDLLGEYVGAVELQERGALHLHVLAAESSRGGGYIQQAALSEMANASGFGPVCDVRTVAPAASAGELPADYLTKGFQANGEAVELAGYVAKSGATEAAKLKVSERMRPLRVSRGWYGGGLRAAEAEVLALWANGQERDPGPWERWHEAEVAGADRRADRRGLSAVAERSRSTAERSGQVQDPAGAPVNLPLAA
jgi:hypothetical protein